MASPDEGRRFLDAHTPAGLRNDPRAAATAITDPGLVLHRALGVPRGGWREMFGTRAWRAGVRAAARGKFIGAKVGDGWTLPVWVVLDGDEVTWRWIGAHAGDRPDPAEIPRMVT
jgi:hypothetical protein